MSLNTESKSIGTESFMLKKLYLSEYQETLFEDTALELVSNNLCQMCIDKTKMAIFNLLRGKILHINSSILFTYQYKDNRVRHYWVISLEYSILNWRININLLMFFTLQLKNQSRGLDKPIQWKNHSKPRALIFLTKKIIKFIGGKI